MNLRERQLPFDWPTQNIYYCLNPTNSEAPSLFSQSESSNQFSCGEDTPGCSEWDSILDPLTRNTTRIAGDCLATPRHSFLTTGTDVEKSTVVCKTTVRIEKMRRSFLISGGAWRCGHVPASHAPDRTGSSTVSALHPNFGKEFLPAHVQWTHYWESDINIEH